MGADTCDMDRYRILVTDPSEPVQKLLSVVLSDPCYQVEFAPDGEQALGQAVVDPPVLVITEIRLNRLDGAALCQFLKGNPRTRGIKVLFLTTSTAELDVRRAQRAGGDGYLTKPFSPTVLLRQVDALLGRSPAEPGQHRGGKRQSCS